MEITTKSIKAGPKYGLEKSGNRVLEGIWDGLGATWDPTADPEPPGVDFGTKIEVELN